MVRGMDQGSVAERVGHDTCSSHESQAGVGKLLKIVQIIKQRQPSFCAPGGFCSSRSSTLFSLSRNITYICHFYKQVSIQFYKDNEGCNFYFFCNFHLEKENQLKNTGLRTVGSKMLLLSVTAI